VSVGALAALVEELPDDLRHRALTHSSWTDERTESYERLAYLGDSVLALVVAADLVHRFPEIDAGGLTKIHNQAVSGVSCAEVGRELGVSEMLEAAEPGGEDAIPTAVLLSGSRPLPEVTEALIGACFVAFGYERTGAAVADAFAARIEHSAETMVDFKSALQELLARRRAKVAYEVVSERGPAHRRTFEVVAVVNSKRVGRGLGRSKKAAEQIAAEEALAHLGG
jgi:ribonuclease-3